MKKVQSIVMVVIMVLLLCGVARADWGPADGHKMHWPQVPDPEGWDVMATEPFILADDFECAETGYIQDIHFWGSWRGGWLPGLTELYGFWISIHEDIPDPDPGDPTTYSMPGQVLLNTFYPIDAFVVAGPFSGPQGWWDPIQGFLIPPPDHFEYFQYNLFLNPADWVHQEAGNIYWLNISAVVFDPFNFPWGWKTTFAEPTGLDLRFLDTSVWTDQSLYPDPWFPIYDPFIGPYEHLDLAFVITGEPDQGPTITPLLTECPVIETECPTHPTWCPEDPTFCPKIPFTECPLETTICPTIPTYCPDSDPTVCEITNCPEDITICPSQLTECPVIWTECPAMETECPITQTLCPMEPYTVCPAIETLCPVWETICPDSLFTICKVTLCPQILTQCPQDFSTLCPQDPRLTMCPIEPTFCPTPGPTICPEQTTECPTVWTECPMFETVCTFQETLCPIEYTICPLGPTICPEDPTYCPDSNPTICKITQCPEDPTICTPGGNVVTECPTEFTTCPFNPTWCPDVPTECPMVWTTCPDIPTECATAETACPVDPTTCPVDPTNCPIGDTFCPTDPTRCPVNPTFCPATDTDNDGVLDCNDNCPNHPNGPLQGTCTFSTPDNMIVSTGQFCTVDADCDPGEFCEKVQADNYPPGGNSIGDACDCEGNFDCDVDVDGLEVTAFLIDFGRGGYFSPCTNSLPCNGDFLCDGDVDGADVTKFLEDFGRGQYFQPCPICPGGPWCVYP